MELAAWEAEAGLAPSRPPTLPALAVAAPATWGTEATAKAAAGTTTAATTTHSRPPGGTLEAATLATMAGEDPTPVHRACLAAEERGSLLWQPVQGSWGARLRLPGLCQSTIGKIYKS
jgi:hypothetical protein